MATLGKHRNLKDLGVCFSCKEERKFWKGNVGEPLPPCEVYRFLRCGGKQYTPRTQLSCNDIPASREPLFPGYSAQLCQGYLPWKSRKPQLVFPKNLPLPLGEEMMAWCKDRHLSKSWRLGVILSNEPKRKENDLRCLGYLRTLSESRVWNQDLGPTVDNWGSQSYWLPLRYHEE